MKLTTKLSYPPYFSNKNTYEFSSCGSLHLQTLYWNLFTIICCHRSKVSEIALQILIVKLILNSAFVEIVERFVQTSVLHRRWSQFERHAPVKAIISIKHRHMAKSSEVCHFYHGARDVYTERGFGFGEMANLHPPRPLRPTRHSPRCAMRGISAQLRAGGVGVAWLHALQRFI
jgi:hypothetical protein